MFKHVVLWKLKEQAEGNGKAANIEKVRALLESCRNVVPGIRRFEIATAQAGLEATSDVILISEFDDAAAYNAYAVHPDHQAIKPSIAAVVEARQCMDFEA